MKEKFEKLDYAKNSVAWLLENADGSVDFHGIAYWAGEVERLRKEVKTFRIVKQERIVRKEVNTPAEILQMFRENAK